MESLYRVNICPPVYIGHMILASLTILAIGLVTSTSVLALSHIFIIIPCIYFAFHTNYRVLPKSFWMLLGLSISIILSIVVNQDIMIKGWKTVFKVKYFLIGTFSIVPLNWWIKERMQEKHLKFLILVFCVSTSVATCAGLIGKFYGFNPILWKKPLILDRNSGLFGMVMNYSHNLSFFLVILLGIWIQQAKSKKLFSNSFLFSVFFLNIIGMYFSYTRGAWLGLIAGVFTYMLIYKFKRKMIIISLLFLALYSGYRIAGNQVIRSSSDNQRIGQWKAALSAFKERPVLGYGYLNFEDHSIELKRKYGHGELNFSSHAHNNFLEILANTGIIGSILFLGWLFFWAKESYQFYGLPLIATFTVGGLTQSTISLGINLFFIMIVFPLSLKINFKQANK